MGRFVQLSQKLGMVSVRHALAFGAVCTTVGATAASLVWASWGGAEPHAQPLVGVGVNSNAGLIGQVVVDAPNFATRSPSTAAVDNETPTEQRRMTLPDYTIEPPDVLKIEARQVVAKVWGGPVNMQPISGEHLVTPDGTVNLGRYGQVRVAGMTLREAKAAIDAHLSTMLDEPDVELSVFAYNSKVYYLIIEGGEGDSVIRLPITGNETVLDALAEARIKGLSSKRIWIARPTPGSPADKVLPVNWQQISKEAATAVNYQLMPGDRVFVAEGFDAAQFLQGVLQGRITLGPHVASKPPRAETAY